MMKASFLDSGGGGVKNKNKKNVNDSVATSLNSPSKVNDGLNTGGSRISTAGTSSLTEKVSKVTEVTDVANPTIGSNIPSGETDVSYVSNTTATPIGITLLLNTAASPSVETINVNPTSSSQNASANKNGGGKVANEPVNEFPSSYANSLVLHLRQIHVFSSTEGVDSVVRDGSLMIHGIPIFLNKWSPSVSLIKEDLSRVPVWVKFHDVPSVVYTSDGLSLIATKMAPKRMINRMDKGKRGSSGVDDEGFIKGKKKKSGGASLKMTLSVGKKNISTSGNGTFSLSNLFKALNVENPVIEEVETGNKASTSRVQEERQSSNPLVEKINIFKKQLLDGKCMMVDDDGTPLEKVDFLGNQGSEDEVESVENEMAS
ncbi:zinc knuckle CX2CX4HX4C containing protein [Tanacetum coccineum]